MDKSVEVVGVEYGGVVFRDVDVDKVGGVCGRGNGEEDGEGEIVDR